MSANIKSVRVELGAALLGAASLFVLPTSASAAAGSFDVHLCAPNGICITLQVPWHFNDTEERWCTQSFDHLMACRDAYFLHAWAADDAQDRISEEPRWQRDAFRHCYWSARMTIHWAAITAYGFGQRHEDTPGNPPMERYMDEWNNYIGYQVGNEAIAAREPSGLIDRNQLRYEYAELECFHLLAEGQLFVIETSKNADWVLQPGTGVVMGKNCLPGYHDCNREEMCIECSYNGDGCETEAPSC